jgi:hypothetical protein
MWETRTALLSIDLSAPVAARVEDISKALTSNGQITGGVTLFGHGGWADYGHGIESAVFLSPDHPLTASNMGILSNANLGPNASITLNACNTGNGSLGTSVAESLSHQLQRPTSGASSGMFFSNNPSARGIAPVDASKPVYMVPWGKMVPFP